MDGSDVGELIAEFNETKALRPEVIKAVWHNSLRLPKKEALTNSEWAIIADDYMKRMGFSETHLRCYVLHDDEDGQHIHIIASRVSLDAGKLYLGRNENLASTRIIQQLERDYNLTRTKGSKASPAAPSPKPKLKKSRNELMMEKGLVSYARKPSSKTLWKYSLPINRQPLSLCISLPHKTSEQSRTSLLPDA